MSEVLPKLGTAELYCKRGGTGNRHNALWRLTIIR